MPMNPRLLRPRQTIHPEAADWANRVRANSGSVSGTTLTAVDRFVKAVYTTGIRDRFYRFNLFAGNSDASLNAVRTPLFRGPSLSGTQYGNTIDTNVNFVQGDYAETGASGGLTGNGTSKYLDTGLSPNGLPSLATGHLAAYQPAVSTTTAVTRSIGSSSGTEVYSLGYRQINGDAYVQAEWGGASVLAARPTAGEATLAGGLCMATRTSSTSLRAYVNGAAIATSSTSVTPGASDLAMFVFARNEGGTAARYISHRLMAYSIGASMTDAQAQSYNTAMQAFQTALGRSV